MEIGLNKNEQGETVVLLQCSNPFQTVKDFGVETENGIDAEENN